MTQIAMFKMRKYGHWYFLGGLAFAALFIWSAVFRVEAHRGRTFLHVFDVGQGDAIFIAAPNGTQVLIDGGPDAAVLRGLGGAMPFWDRSLDLVILTHPHADHLDGLIEVLRRYRVGMVLESGVNHSIPEYDLWHAELRERGVPVIVAERGEAVRLAEDLTLTVLAPAHSFAGPSPRNIHDAAIVLMLRHASSTALLMADAEAPLERELLAAGGNIAAELVKIGHHGSRTSTLEGFLVAVKPRVAVISAGRRNRYGHPVQEALERLAAVGTPTYRTDRDGTVTFVSEGREVRLAETGIRR